jgi:hypothetical protein
MVKWYLWLTPSTMLTISEKPILKYQLLPWQERMKSYLDNYSKLEAEPFTVLIARHMKSSQMFASSLIPVFLYHDFYK